MSLLSLPLLLFAFGDIVLDPEIARVSSLKVEGDRFYIVDYFQSVLYETDRSGKLMRTFHRKGNGPGEVQGLNKVAIHKDSVFILDPNANKVVQLDRDFTYQDQHFLSWIPTGLAVNDNYIFVYHYDYKTDTIAHQYDRQMNHIRSFGQGLDKSLVAKLGKYEQVGFQVTQALGDLFVHKDRVFVSHCYKLQMEEYDFQGKLKQVYKLPGVAPMDYYDHTKQRFKLMTTAMGLDSDGNIYMALTGAGPGIKSIPPMAMYRFDIKAQTWGRASDWRLNDRMLPDGSFLSVIEQEGEDAGLILRRKDLAFKSTPSNAEH